MQLNIVAAYSVVGVIQILQLAKSRRMGEALKVLFKTGTPAETARSAGKTQRQET